MRENSHLEGSRIRFISNPIDKRLKIRLIRRTAVYSTFAILVLLSLPGVASAQAKFVNITSPTNTFGGAASVFSGSPMTVTATIGPPPAGKTIGATQVIMNGTKEPFTQYYAHTDNGRPGMLYTLNFNAPTIPPRAVLNLVLTVQVLDASGVVIPGGQDSVNVVVYGPPM